MTNEENIKSEFFLTLKKLIREEVKKELLRNNGTLVASYNFWGHLVEFIDNLAFDPRDVTNYLILKYPQVYKLLTIAGTCSDLDDGICLSKKMLR